MFLLSDSLCLPNHLSLHKAFGQEKPNKVFPGLTVLAFREQAFIGIGRGSRCQGFRFWGLTIELGPSVSMCSCASGPERLRSGLGVSRVIAVDVVKP